MSVSKSREQILGALLEKILFNQKELNVLKERINQVSLKTINPNELRNHIFGARIHIMEELLEFFPFYVKESINSNVNNESLQSERDLSLVEQIKEREELLEIVAKRLVNIHKKLKEKKNTEVSNNVREISEVSQHIQKDQKQDTKVTKKKLVVDLTNILNLDKDQNQKIKIENILNVYNAVVGLGYEPHMIADASMRHHLNSADQYEDLKEKKIIRQSPAGTKADEWVLEVAKRENCKFLTNDLYREHRAEFGNDWVFNNRFTCIFSNGKFIIRENKHTKENKTGK